MPSASQTAKGGKAEGRRQRAEGNPHNAHLGA